MRTSEFRRGRPDEIDRGIVRYLADVKTGATVQEINKKVCPERRETFVRYRIDTLHEAGIIDRTDVYGRVVVFPTDSEQDRGGMVNG